MAAEKYYYSFVVNKNHLDSFNHVNNAMYLTLFEDARWELLDQNNFGLRRILETKIGPVILEIKIQFLKELHLGDEILIETEMLSYEKKIGVLLQKMIRKNEVCCIAEFVLGLFDLKERKLILPTEDWLKAVGLGNK